MNFDIRKIQKRIRIHENRSKGKLAETAYVINARAQGREIERTGRGSDFRERKVNPATGRKGPWTHIEVKSGGARQSPLQRKTQKKVKRYRVERLGW